MLLKNYPESERLNAVSQLAEWLYCRLLAKSDDAGNYYGEAGLVASYACGHRLAKSQVTVEQVKGWLSELAHPDIDLIRFYNDDKHIHLMLCYKYLRPDVERDIRFPAEPAEFGGIINVRNLAESGTDASRSRDGNGTLREGKGSEGKVREVGQVPPPPEFRALAELLDSRIRENYPTAASSKQADGPRKARLTKWAEEFETICRIDKLTPTEVAAAINAAHNDRVPHGGGDFCWASIIRSPEKVRKHYDRLVGLRPGQRQGGQRPTGPVKVRL